MSRGTVEDAFQDYYRFLDSEIASFLELVPEDAVTMVMSDHGARPMMGGLCFNDWLAREGYLTLAEPGGVTADANKDASIDWSRTIAWGDGGYYGRLFLNGRVVSRAAWWSPPGTRRCATSSTRSSKPHPGLTVSRSERRSISHRTSIRRSGGSPGPFVYFGDLGWRSVGSVGNPSLYTYENDTGPDGANHDRDGIFVMTGAPGQPSGRVEGLNLVNVGPTILSLYGIEASEALPGATGRSFL